MKTKIETLTKIIAVSFILSCMILALSNEVRAQEPTKEVKTCKGTKADKTPCKSVILLKNGYCYAHNPDAIKCSGKNAKKENCGMTVKNAGEFCRFHSVK